MTPKEKAKEILNRVRPHAQYWDCYNDCPLEENHAVKIALICVNQLLEFPFSFTSIEYGEWSSEYWQEVKKELENFN